MITLAIADDHLMFCETVVAAFRTRPEFSVVGLATSSGEIIALMRQFRPQVLIIDAQLPDLGVLETMERIRQMDARSVPVLLVEAHHVEVIAQALALRVRGIVAKQRSLDDLVQAVRVVAEGGMYVEIDQDTLDASLRSAVRRADVAGNRSVAFDRAWPIDQTTCECAGHQRPNCDHLRERLSHKLGMRGVANLTRYAVRIGLVEL